MAGRSNRRGQQRGGGAPAAHARGRRAPWRQLLRHGNLILDAEQRAQLELRRLQELLGLVQEGRAVEVTHLWGQQAVGLCRDALVGMATRLELHVRIAVQEHESQRRAMTQAERALADMKARDLRPVSPYLARAPPELPRISPDTRARPCASAQPLLSAPHRGYGPPLTSLPP